MKLSDQDKDKIKNHIAERLDLDHEIMTDTANLHSELMMDSLDAVELEIDFELMFDIRIDEAKNDSVFGCKTVSDIYDLIERQ